MDKNPNEVMIEKIKEEVGALKKLVERLERGNSISLDTNKTITDEIVDLCKEIDRKCFGEN